MKSSTHYFHVKTKILADFQICISVPLIIWSHALMKDTENIKTVNLMVRQIKQKIKGNTVLLAMKSPRKRKLPKLIKESEKES